MLIGLRQLEKYIYTAIQGGSEADRQADRYTGIQLLYECKQRVFISGTFTFMLFVRCFYPKLQYHVSYCSLNKWLRIMLRGPAVMHLLSYVLNK